MSPDQIVYLSGNVPFGLNLIPLGIGILSFLWIFVWWGTRFWNWRALILNLVLIWVTVPIIYAAIWYSDRPHPVPVRVIVTTNSTVSPQQSEVFSHGFAESVKSYLSLSEFPFVILDSGIIPQLKRYELTGTGNLDSIALSQSAHWLVEIDSEYHNVNANIRQILDKQLGQNQTVNSELGSFNLNAIDLAMKIKKQISGYSGNFDSEKSVSFSTFRYPDLPDSVYELYCQALVHRSKGDFASSLKILPGLCNTDTSWTLPRQELVRNLLQYLTTYHKDSLYTTLISLIEKDEQDHENYILLGRYFMEFAMWEEAESALKLSLDKTLFAPRIFFYLSRLNIKRINELEWETKQDLLRRALYLAPGYENARLALADYHIIRNDKLDAQLIMEEGLEIDPSSRALRMAYAANLIGRKQYDQAEKIFRELLDAQFPDPKILYNLGITLLGKDEYDAAIAALDSSFKIGGNADNFYYMGVAYQEKGDYDNALLQFQKRTIMPKGLYDRVAVSAREQTRRLKKWIAERDSLALIKE